MTKKKHFGGWSIKKELSLDTLFMVGSFLVLAVAAHFDMKSRVEQNTHAIQTTKESIKLQIDSVQSDTMRIEGKVDQLVMKLIGPPTPVAYFRPTNDE